MIYVTSIDDSIASVRFHASTVHNVLHVIVLLVDVLLQVLNRWFVVLEVLLPSLNCILVSYIHTVPGFRRACVEFPSQLRLRRPGTIPETGCAV